MTTKAEKEAKAAAKEVAKQAEKMGEVGTTESGIVAPAEAIANIEQPTYEATDAEKGDVVVQWKEHGHVNTRAYSKELHGKDFAKLAEEFAEKKRGKVFKK